MRDYRSLEHKIRALVSGRLVDGWEQISETCWYHPIAEIARVIDEDGNERIVNKAGERVDILFEKKDTDDAKKDAKTEKKDKAPASKGKDKDDDKAPGKKQDEDDPKQVKGGKTEVDIHPKTKDSETDDKKAVKEELFSAEELAHFDKVMSEEYADMSKKNIDTIVNAKGKPHKVYTATDETRHGMSVDELKRHLGVGDSPHTTKKFMHNLHTIGVRTGWSHSAGKWIAYQGKKV